MQYSTVQYSVSNAVQYSAVQCCAMQYSVEQYSVVCLLEEEEDGGPQGRTCLTATQHSLAEFAHQGWPSACHQGVTWQHAAVTWQHAAVTCNGLGGGALRGAIDLLPWRVVHSNGGAAR
jgi:hypothetical protein